MPMCDAQCPKCRKRWRLLAAAPDLLAACEATLAWVHTLPPSPGFYAAVDRLSAAIAKALDVPGDLADGEGV